MEGTRYEDKDKAMKTKKNIARTATTSATAKTGGPITADALRSYAATVAQIGAAMEPFEAMGTDERRRTVKVRKGAERIIESIALLAGQANVRVKGLSPEQMAESQARASSLAPLETALRQALAQVTAARYAAAVGAYTDALKLYSILRQLAASDVQLATALQPIEDFFSYRHESVIQKQPSKLQRRAKAQMAHAEELMAHARPHVGADTTATSTPVAAAAPSALAQPALTATVKSNAATNGTAGSVPGYVNGVSAVGTTGNA